MVNRRLSRIADEWLQDIAWAARQFRNSLSVSMLAVFTLGLGVAGTLTAIGVVERFVTSPLAVPRPESLVAVTALDPNDRPAAMTIPLVDAIGKADVGLAQVAGYLRNGWLTVSVGGNLQRRSVAAVSGEYHNTLGLSPLVGRLIDRSDMAAEGVAATRVAVLSESYWRTQFGGDPAAVGRELNIEGLSFRIIGVTPPRFTGLEVGTPTDITLPLSSVAAVLGLPPNWPVPVTHVLGRVSPDGQASTRARLNTLWPGLVTADMPANYSARQRQQFTSMRPFVSDASRGFSHVREAYAQRLVVLLALSGILLLVTCANVAALLLSRAAARQHEFSVRLALGASRNRLSRPLFAESIMLAAAGTAIGLPVSAWGEQAIARAILVTSIPEVSALDWQAPAGSMIVALILIVAIVCGVGPAWLISRSTSPHAILGFRGSIAVAAQNRWTQRVLSLQVASAVVLLSSAALFVSALAYLRNGPHGFRPDGVIVASLVPQPGGYTSLNDSDYYRRLIEAVLQLPGVEAAALSKSTPVSGRDAVATQSINRLESPGLDDDLSAALEVVTPGFFRALSMTFLAGRDFDWRDDLRAAPVAILSSSVAERLFPIGDALGNYIRYGSEPQHQTLQIVGVTADASITSLSRPKPPMVFVSWLQQPPPYARWPTVEIRATANLSLTAEALRGAVHSLGHEYVESVRTLDEQVERSLTREALLASLSAFFGLVATLLVCIGIAAALTHLIVRQRREIGMRMALGASGASLQRFVMQKSLGVTLRGLAVGVPLALAASVISQRYVSAGSSSPTVSVLQATGILIALTLVAACGPARRAARTSPADALRGE